jgi:hypothetical protein
MIKTGECYWRDEDGNLWLAESFLVEDGTTYTQDFLLEKTEK